ncbi:MAG: DUF4190 domain-containing protein [Candidatus Promineifilaceae bacterium]|nr:DUF4190 domain-containing protein [Candidatus Promineifilaceae bacterium]
MKDEEAGDRREYEENVTTLEEIPATTVAPTNDMALVSFLAGAGGWVVAIAAICPISQYVGGLCILPLAFVAWTVALFTGFIARGQIATGDEEGDDMATWGLIAGGAGLVLGTLALVLLALLLLLGIVGLGALTPFFN